MFLRMIFVFFLGGGEGLVVATGQGQERKEKEISLTKKVFGEVVGVWGLALSQCGDKLQKATDQPKVQGKINFSVRVRMRVAGFLFTQDSVLE